MFQDWTTLSMKEFFLQPLFSHPIAFHEGDKTDPTVSLTPLCHPPRAPPGSTRATWAGSAARGVNDAQLGEDNEELLQANHLGFTGLAPALISMACAISL